MGFKREGCSCGDCFGRKCGGNGGMKIEKVKESHGVYWRGGDENEVRERKSCF